MRSARTEADVADERARPAHLEGVSESEINEFDAVLALLHHHVFGFEVAVQVACLMQVTQGSEHLQANGGDCVQ